MDEQPEISGLSPRVATESGGTKITIRGMNLGLDENDIIGLTLCGISHIQNFTWVSPNKIEILTVKFKLANRPDVEFHKDGTTRTLNGPVLLTTASGGVCQQTLQFTFLESEEEVDEDDEYNAESNVWVHRKPRVMFATGAEQSVRTTVVIDTTADPLGILKQKSEPSAFVGRGNNLRGRNSTTNNAVAASGDASNPNFLPGTFLAERHSNTPLDKLITGHTHLRTLIGTRADAVRGLMKDNFDRYVACQDSIISISNYNGNQVTQNLQESLDLTLHSCTEFSDPLLVRKKRIDSIRNVTSVIQKFKFLFQLPYNLNSYIYRSDYGAAVTDLKKAESLYDKTEIGVFKEAMVEVRKCRDELIEVLYTKLKDKKTTIRQRKRFIKYLMELQESTDKNVDPGWECLDVMMQHIIDEMNEIEKEMKLEMSPRAETKKMLYFDGAPTMVTYMEKIVKTLTNRFPPLWKLSQFYFHGTLYKDISADAAERVQGRQSEFKKMINAILATFITKIQDAFWPNDNNKHKAPMQGFFEMESIQSENVTSLLKCIQILLKGYAEIYGLRGINESIMRPLYELCIDFRLHLIEPIFSQCSKEIDNLKSWSVLTDFLDQPTLLCDEYASFVELVVISLSDVAVMKVANPKSLARSDGKRRSVESLMAQDDTSAIDYIQEEFFNLLIAFEKIVAYHALEYPIQAEVERYRKNQTIYDLALGVPYINHIDTEHFAFEAYAEHIQSQRLLRMVACCVFNNQTTLLALARVFEDGFGCPFNRLTELTQRFGSLSDSFLSKYNHAKIGLSAKRVDACLFPSTGKENVRDFVLETFLQVVTISHEVDTADADLTDQIINVVVEGIGDQILFAVQAVNIQSQNRAPIFKRKSTIEAWNKQMIVDLEAMRLCFHKYYPSRSDSSFEAALQILGRCCQKPYDDDHVRQIMQRFQAKHSFQLICFK